MKLSIRLNPNSKTLNAGNITNLTNMFFSGKTKPVIVYFCTTELKSNEINSKTHHKKSNISFHKIATFIIFIMILYLVSCPSVGLQSETNTKQNESAVVVLSGNYNL